MRRGSLIIVIAIVAFAATSTSAAGQAPVCPANQEFSGGIAG